MKEKGKVGWRTVAEDEAYWSAALADEETKKEEEEVEVVSSRQQVIHVIAPSKARNRVTFGRKAKGFENRKRKKE